MNGHTYLKTVGIDRANAKGIRLYLSATSHLGLSPNLRRKHQCDLESGTNHDSPIRGGSPATTRENLHWKGLKPFAGAVPGNLSRLRLKLNSFDAACSHPHGNLGGVLAGAAGWFEEEKRRER